MCYQTTCYKMNLKISKTYQLLNSNNYIEHIKNYGRNPVFYTYQIDDEFIKVQFIYTQMRVQRLLTLKK